MYVCMPCISTLTFKWRKLLLQVPPEWIQEQNEMLVWSDSKLPTNVTAIDPSLASVVYRADPPAIWTQVEALLSKMSDRLTTS